MAVKCQASSLLGRWVLQQLLGGEVRLQQWNQVEASWRAGPSCWRSLRSYAPALQGSPKIFLGAVMLKLAVYYMRTPSKIIQVPSVKTCFGGSQNDSISYMLCTRTQIPTLPVIHMFSRVEQAKTQRRQFNLAHFSCCKGVLLKNNCLNFQTQIFRNLSVKKLVSYHLFSGKKNSSA